ncbi:MAG: hypothetical protein ACAI35_27055 [Candidatus Methylacidiphilales bacterium]|nr:hypothetical protein [Candidatus Methylacidiphilales bacterium]
MATAGETQQRYRGALDRLVQRLRADRTILATVLCGSLSHDTVWEKSDIDLVLVMVDDEKIARHEGIALVEDDVNIHAMLWTRGEFRKMAEGSKRNSFIHSLLAKGRLIYSHDPSLETLFPQLQRIGSRDTQDQLLRAGISVLPFYDKAQKWFLTRGDLHYASLWLLYAATPLAQIEVYSRGLLADREVLPQALKLNPEFFGPNYTELLDKPKTKARIAAAIASVGTYLSERRELLFKPVLDYLREAGEIRSATEIEHEFTKQHGISGVITACEYLAYEGVITKAGSPVRLTRRSNVQVEEMAFVHLSDQPDLGPIPHDLAQ